MISFLIMWGTLLYSIKIFILGVYFQILAEEHVCSEENGKIRILWVFFQASYFKKGYNNNYFKVFENLGRKCQEKQASS